MWHPMAGIGPAAAAICSRLTELSYAAAIIPTSGLQPGTSSLLPNAVGRVKILGVGDGAKPHLCRIPAIRLRTISSWHRSRRLTMVDHEECRWLAEAADVFEAEA